MPRLSRELISAPRLSFDARPDVGRLRNKLSRGFRRGLAEKAVVRASDRVISPFICIRGSRTRLRQSGTNLERETAWRPTADVEDADPTVRSLSRFGIDRMNK